MSELRIQAYEGPPPSEVGAGVEALAQVIFGPEEGGVLGDLGTRHRPLLLVACRGEEILGFKLGWAESRRRFYSQLGGVAPAARGQGLARRLLRRQHAWAREQGFERVRTKTSNRWRAMLLLNILEGFEVVGTELHPSDGLKIVLERHLEDLGECPPAAP